MRREHLSVVITLFLLTLSFLNLSMVLNPTNIVLAENPPPNDGINGTQYIEGHWNVTSDMIYTDEVIILTGNLTISSGGSLTFENVTLMMNCTNIDEEYNIEVNEGGTFNILNGSIITDSPFDVDDNSLLDYEYMFWVRAGSNLTMKNSELHECGWDFVKVGLYIFTDNVILENNTISNNYYGAYFYTSSNNTIIENRVFNNKRSGIWYWDTHNCLIVNNNFYNNTEYGIGIQRSSNNNISKNEIHHNVWGGLGFGIFAENNKCFDNIIYNNNGYGISIANSNENEFINTNISNHQYGIHIFQGSINNTFLNGSIINSTSNDFWLDDDSHTIVLNMTFITSNVYYEDTDSTLTVKWFLDVYANTTDGIPLPYATTYIKDTNGDPVIGSPFKTNPKGFARWIPVTQYIEQDITGDGTGERTFFTPYNISVTKDIYTGYAAPEPYINFSRQVNVSLQIPPQQPLHHIRIYPAGPEDYYVDDLANYMAIGWNDPEETQKNITWVPIWSIDNPFLAEIDQYTGYFQALNVGNSIVNVTSSEPTVIYNTSVFNVIPWPLHHLEIIPVGAESYYIGDNATYMAIGWNDESETQQNTSWTPLWGLDNTSVGSIDGLTGEFTAIGLGNGIINVTDADMPWIYQTSDFNVEPWPLHHITITPKGRERYYLGDEVIYTAIGWNDATETQQNHSWTPVWSTENISLAEIDPNNGTFKVVALGSGVVNVTSAYPTGIFNTSGFIVEPWPLHHMIITPAGPENYYVGDERTYSAVGWNDAKETQMNSTWTPVWDIDDDSIANVDNETGLFTAVNLGTFKIICKSSLLPEISNYSAFTVLPWPLHHLVIMPIPPQYYYIGDHNNYTVIGWNDADETQMNNTWIPLWKVNDTSLGSIDETGFFTALDVGWGRINVSSTSRSDIYTTNFFTIDPWPLHHISITPSSSGPINIGDEITFTVVGWNDEDETQQNNTWISSWHIDGDDIGDITPEDNGGTFLAKKSGEGTIRCMDDDSGVFVSVDIVVKKETDDGIPIWIWLLIIGIIAFLSLILLWYIFLKRKSKEMNGTENKTS